MTVTIDNATVYQQYEANGESTRIVHHCATRRVAQILAATLELQSAGWSTCGLSTRDGARRPLLLAGERIGALLDGSLSDQRAQGFTASCGDAGSITVDACAGMPTIALAEYGDTTEARRIIEWHLGPLS